MRPLPTSTFFENLGQDADLAKVGHVEDRAAIGVRELHLVEVWAEERKRKLSAIGRRLAEKDRARKAKAKEMRDRRRLEGEFTAWAKELDLVWSRTKPTFIALEARFGGSGQWGETRYYVPRVVRLVLDHGPTFGGIETLATLVDLTLRSTEYAELVEGTYTLGGARALSRLLAQTRAHPRG